MMRFFLGIVLVSIVLHQGLLVSSGGSDESPEVDLDTPESQATEFSLHCIKKLDTSDSDLDEKQINFAIEAFARAAYVIDYLFLIATKLVATKRALAHALEEEEEHEHSLRRVKEKVEEFQEKLGDHIEDAWDGLRANCKALEDKDNLNDLVNDNIPEILKELGFERALAGIIALLFDEIKKSKDNGPWTVLARSTFDYVKFLTERDIILTEESGKDLNSAKN